MNKTATLYFAGGCFWGTEHYFKQIRGVLSTKVGYANGNTKNPTYKELASTTYVSREGLVTHIDKHILFQKEKVRHEARCVELWSNNSRKSVTLSGGLRLKKWQGQKVSHLDK